MKRTKRIISIILLVTLLAGMVPTTAQAEETKTTVENGGTTIEGTNSFGMLLSEDIQEQQAAEEENHSGGYNVIGLTIENGVATVQYDTLEDAVLVVSLYTEDGLQLLVSDNAVVKPDSTEAVITLEGELPEYFMASAYLLDTYDYSPLCSSYSTPMYTREMQELLASTTDDYAADRILNLDDDKTTNFAVYTESTIVIEAKDGINTVTSVDEENSTYIIGNVDENITELQTGDVFAYPYGNNEILIVKVATITINGTVATITGDELEIEEVFSHMKLESSGDSGDLIVDETTGDEGISYVGKISDEAAVMSLSDPYAVSTAVSEEDVSGKISLGFKLEKESGSITLKGSLTLDAKVEFSYYISTSRQYVEFKTDVNTALALEVSGKASFPVLKIPALGFSPVPGVYIGFEPQLVLEFTAKVEASFNVGFTKGFSYENGVGVADLSTSPKVDFALDVEGTIFFGLDLAPHVSVLDGWVAKFTFSALSGIELKAEMGGTNFDDVQIIGGAENPESIHTCESCLGAELYGKMEFSIKLDFLKFINLSFKLSDTTFSIGECYYSFDQRDFGWGSCPNKSYRVTVYVQNAQGFDAFGIDVVAGWAEQLTGIPLGTTNSNGVVVDYLQAGTYTFMATVDGENLGKTVTIEEACKVTLDKGSVSGVPTFISGIVNAESITDNGIVASGECGADGDNVTWTLYGSGVLHIQGTGGMANYTSSSKSPWYDYRLYISRVIIDAGVSGIGNRAFYDCTGITAIDISDSVMSIGTRAFYNCSSLTTVKVPVGVTSIGSYTFYKCSSMTDVELHDGITTIDDRAFSGCSSLKSITVPEKLTFLGYYAFYNCESLQKVYVSNLLSWCGITFDGYYTNPLSYGGKLYVNGVIEKEITLPDNLLVVPNYLFNGCSSITHVSIPDGVTEIGTHAFEDCDNLNTIYIPSSVTSIGSYVFCGSGITSCVIPDGVQEVPDLMFQWCDSLTRVVVGKSVTSIGTTAFAYCSDLEEIIFTGDAPSTIEYGAFLMTPAIRYYPAENETWAEFLLENTSDKWQPYTSLDSLMTAQVDDQLVGAEEDLQDQNTEDVADTSEDLAGVPSLTSIYDGEYSTQVNDSYILKTASFSGLVAGEEYVLLALISIESEDVLAPDNLLYIDQEMADEDGTLVFTYVQRDVTDTSYVMACGASHNDLSEAVITFPSMMATSETQAVHPTVIYDGESLTEGVDYVVVGTVDYTTAGEYTCYVRGIYNYTGLVQCQYIVLNTAPGDVDGDGEVSDWDAIMLNRYLAGWSVEINLAAADVDSDGEVSDWDAIVLERYLAGWVVKLES